MKDKMLYSSRKDVTGTGLSMVKIIEGVMIMVILFLKEKIH
jgi:hypothetical protein